MNLEDQILMDTNGNFLYQGCIAKPFSQYYCRNEWLVVVGGVNDPQHQVWHTPNPSPDARTVALAAIDWFIKNHSTKSLKNDSEEIIEVCDDKPTV